MCISQIHCLILNNLVCHYPLWVCKLIAGMQGRPRLSY